MEEPPPEGNALYPVRKTTQEIDPDTQCAVPLVTGNVLKRGVIKNPRCTYRLTCKIHTTQQKERVPGRSESFAELVRRQPLRLGDQRTDGASQPLRPVDQQTGVALPVVIDPDVHCAILDSEGSPCSNSLIDCQDHTLTQKSDVPGRCPISFADLTRISKLNLSAEVATLQQEIHVDIHCHVPLLQGGHCAGKLSCPTHSLEMKRRIKRAGDFFDMLELQTKLTIDTDLHQLKGFGLMSVSAPPEDKESYRICRRYRRAGLQSAKVGSHPQGEVDDILYTQTRDGEQLENIRSLLCYTTDTRPRRHLTDFLPSQKRLDLPRTCSHTFDDGTSYHFCFVDKPQDLSDDLDHMRQALNDMRLTEGCMISASKTEYGLDENKAAMLERRLRGLLARLPFELSMLADVLKHRLLITAMLMHPDHPLDVPSKIPFHFEQALVDGKPSVVLRTTQFGARSEKHYTGVAIPLLDSPKEGFVADPSPVFEFSGLEARKSWVGVQLNTEKQTQICDIAKNIANDIHLMFAEPQQIRAIVAMLGKMHDISLLVRQGESPEFDPVSFEDGVAVLDEATGVITPSPSTSSVAPFLPPLRTRPGTLGGHLVLQTINARFMRTGDLLVAWADGCNSCDFQTLYGERTMRQVCYCSKKESKTYYHRCKACGSMAVCKNMVPTMIKDVAVRVCALCVTDRSATSQQESESISAQKIGSGTSSSQAEKRRVGNNLSMQMMREYDKVFPDLNRDGMGVERKEAQTTLLASFTEAVGDQPWQWHDAYLESPITADQGRLSCSVETAQPMVWYKGRPREHVPGNMVLTKLFANCLAGSNGGIALQLLHKLDAAKTPEEIGSLVLRIDNLHLIRSQIPWSEDKRLATDFDEEFQSRFIEECQTGVANLAACEKISDLDSPASTYLWRISFKERFLDRSMESIKGLKEVRQFIADLEQESGHTFRRIGDEQAPYPFIGGPDPMKWTWGILFGIGYYHLDILRRNCNLRGTTGFDLPRLLCGIFYSIAYKRDRFPSQLLNLPVCVYTRHTLGLSVGKANHAADMTCGLRNDQAISLANFSVDECNLCVEPWACNVAKGNRDEDVDTIREDFRQNLKDHNPPYWTQELHPLDPQVTETYLRGAPQALGSFGADEQPPQYDNNLQRIPEKRNLRNVGQTCYLSTMVQTLHNMREYRDLVADEENLKYVVDTGLGDVAYLPAIERPSSLDQNEITLYREQKLLNIRLLVLKLRKLFRSLDLGGEQLPEYDTKQLISRVSSLDSRWQNHSEEPAQLLALFIEYIIMACDSSSPAGKGKIALMGSSQERDNKEGRLLFDVKLDADA
jgi:hypothetical protein